MKQILAFFRNYVHLFLSLPVFFIALNVHQPANAEVVDRIVAVVNSDVITLSEVEKESAGLYRTLAKKNPGRSPFETMEEARENTLNSLISQLLISQKAKQSNVRASEEEIDAAYESTRARSTLNPTEFREKLQEAGTTEESYRHTLKMQILQSKLLNNDVRSKIVITDQMILDYYNTNYTTTVEKGSFYLLQMGFTWDEDDNPESKKVTRQRAERVYNLIKGGQEFRTLARKFSDLPSAGDGGDIGAFTLEDMASAMRSAVAPLEPGELSTIIETPSGYQFYKLLSGDGNETITTSSYEAAKEEIKEILYEDKLKEAYNVWIEELQEQAYIQKL